MTNIAISSQEKNHLISKLNDSKKIIGPDKPINKTVEAQNLDSRRGLKIVEGAK